MYCVIAWEIAVRTWFSRLDAYFSMMASMLSKMLGFLRRDKKKKEMRRLADKKVMRKRSGVAQENPVICQ